MRLIFIPGLGENPDVFDLVAPALPGEKVLIDNWQELHAQRNAMDYARHLATKFQMDKDDVVIGHSMGGWVAIHLKQLTGCRVVQIASWTNQKKIIRPFPLPDWLSVTLARLGLYFLPSVRDFLVRKNYEGKPSRDFFISVFNRLMSADRTKVVAQLHVLLNQTALSPQTQPDLRIHTKGDLLISVPDEPFIEVPGDHFTLITHSASIASPIEALLKTRVG